MSEPNGGPRDPREDYKGISASLSGVTTALRDLGKALEESLVSALNRTAERLRAGQAEREEMERDAGER